ncbi:hypothetical protein BDQ12DRAFT_748910 [Crucibulum laeve]|uniref:Uncharacterized protein n=1 Tax=Crucibulum laeve TaxID=68775 RepID=A0A5C3LRT1_9AGAR|nr:hypothetical protein BDQ12DRAFT_748910 [Crucibulum laeve]
MPQPGPTGPAATIPEMPMAMMTGSVDPRDGLRVGQVGYVRSYFQPSPPPPRTSPILGYNSISEDCEPSTCGTSLCYLPQEGFEDADVDSFGILALEEKLKAGRPVLGWSIVVEVPGFGEWDTQMGRKTMLKQAGGSTCSSSLAMPSIQKETVRKTDCRSKGCQGEGRSPKNDIMRRRRRTELEK